MRTRGCRMCIQDNENTMSTKEAVRLSQVPVEASFPYGKMWLCEKHFKEVANQ